MPINTIVINASPLILLCNGELSCILPEMFQEPEIVRWDLGSGETDVLSFAFTHRDYVPVLDDQAAKKCALSFDIPTLGTGSMLILAKEHGIIDSVGNALLTLRDAGMWISDECNLFW